MPSGGASLISRRNSAPIAGWVIASSALRSSSVANAFAASAGRSSVPSARQDLGPEALDDRRQGRLAGLHHPARDQIAVDDDRATFREQLGHGRLPRPDSTRQAHQQHGRGCYGTAHAPEAIQASRAVPNVPIVPSVGFCRGWEPETLTQTPAEPPRAPAPRRTRRPTRGRRHDDPTPAASRRAGPALGPRLDARSVDHARPPRLARHAAALGQPRGRHHPGPDHRRAGRPGAHRRDRGAAREHDLPHHPPAAAPARHLAGRGDAAPRPRARGPHDHAHRRLGQPAHPHAAPDGDPRRVRLGVPRGARHRRAHRRARSRWPTRSTGVSEDTLRTGILASVVVLARRARRWLHPPALARGRAHASRRPLDQVTRMSIANDLLHALHDVVQTLPSLARPQRRRHVRAARRSASSSTPTVAVVLVPDDTSDVVARRARRGRAHARDARDSASCPTTLQAGARRPTASSASDDLPAGNGAACGTDEPQRARHRAARPGPRRRPRVDRALGRRTRTRDEDASLIAGLASSLALAVDNARWFSRLRTLGAEAERARIARDLHDNVAQSLAYVGFELDRLATVHDDDPELKELQGVVRGVVAELRETLYQLRANVSENQDLVDVARDYIVALVATAPASRPSSRPHTGGRRVPVQVEQELWRILQESLTNVERHADASHAWVSWRIGDGRSAARSTGRRTRA